ncbi:MAG: septal ring lytic transglycosylase RlpA family protein, partial [Thiobacillaceae bacterium]
PPPNLPAVPDATPQAAPLHRFANRPYIIKGVSYTPDLSGEHYLARGLASWYGRRFHGKPTSSGEPYDMYAMTAAHRTLPIPSYARVTNVDNGRSVVVRINDRGPFHPDRIIDLSYTAAYKLGLLGGVGTVEVERLLPEEGDAATSFAAGAEDMPSVLASENAATATTPLPDAVRTSTQTASPPAAGVYLQVGAFLRPEAAQALADRLVRGLGWQVPGVLQQQEGGLIKVQAGPYTSVDEADRAARGIVDSLGVRPYRVQARPASANVPEGPGAQTPARADAAQLTHWLQLAAFANPQSADRLLERLKAERDVALPGVEKVEADGLIKVQAGPFGDAGQADQAAIRLIAALGHKPYRVMR